MSIFEKKGELSSSRAESEKMSLPGQEKKPEKKEEPKEVKKDTSAFKGKPFLRPDEIRQWLRNDPNAYKITGLPEQERVKLEKKWFEGKYANEERGKRKLKKLKEEKYKEPTGVKKAKIDKEIKLLERFLSR